MDDVFDAWNEKKKILATGTSGHFPRESEVWLIALGKNVGREQDGGKGNFSRPALVIKKFNTEMFWIVPLSTKQKSLGFYYNFTDGDGNRVSAIVAQLRLVSAKRFKRKMYIMASTDCDAVKKKIREYAS